MDVNNLTVLQKKYNFDYAELTSLETDQNLNEVKLTIRAPIYSRLTFLTGFRNRDLYSITLKFTFTSQPSGGFFNYLKRQNLSDWKHIILNIDYLDITPISKETFHFLIVVEGTSLEFDYRDVSCIEEPIFEDHQRASV